jgi:hypothetical protein
VTSVEEGGSSAERRRGLGWVGAEAAPGLASGRGPVRGTEFGDRAGGDETHPAQRMTLSQVKVS